MNDVNAGQQPTADKQPMAWVQITPARRSGLQLDDRLRQTPWWSFTGRTNFVRKISDQPGNYSVHAQSGWGFPLGTP